MSRFSIILPVRNGGHYVKSCVQAILAQSVRDFELLVLDNHSSDGTLEWIQSIGDNRIKIYPSPVSLTIEENWSRVISIPKAEFMTMIGHDDLLQENYLETMDLLIRQFPAASLYQTHFNYIDAGGKKIRACLPMPEKMDAEGFLSAYLQKKIDLMGTGFMMRSKDYDELGGIPAYPNLLFADFELWIGLVRKSFLAVSPAQCFSFRLHQSMTTRSEDIRYHQSFERFIYFLENLGKKSGSMEMTIREHAAPWLEFYCKALSHRLLRTPTRKRAGLTVKGFVRKCENFAELLRIRSSFNAGKKTSVRLARFIDSNGLTRKLFLIFKKLFPRPILK